MESRAKDGNKSGQHTVDTDNERSNDAPPKQGPTPAVRNYNVERKLQEEIDLKKDLWTIPGERMKMGKDHSILLTDPIKEVFDTLRSFNG